LLYYSTLEISSKNNGAVLGFGCDLHEGERSHTLELGYFLNCKAVGDLVVSCGRSGNFLRLGDGSNLRVSQWRVPFPFVCRRKDSVRFFTQA
jgi:hypothetical protein